MNESAPKFAPRARRRGSDIDEARRDSPRRVQRMAGRRRSWAVMEFSEAMESSEGLNAGIVVALRPFEAFFQEQHVRLGRALYLLTGDASEADEIAQEALVRVYERWDRVCRMESPEGYLYRTALNLHRSRVRWLASRARQLLQPAAADDPADTVQRRDSIARALGSLPAGQRGAVILVEWLGMDTETAAQALGIKPGSLRARLSRAKTALRQDRRNDDV